MEEIRKTNSEKLGQNQDGNPYFNRKLPKSLNYLEYCKEAKSFLFWGQIWDDFPKKILNSRQNPKILDHKQPWSQHSATHRARKS